MWSQLRKTYLSIFPRVFPKTTILPTGLFPAKIINAPPWGHDSFMIILLFKTILVYLILLLLMRLVGKRQIGDLELGELIVTILISEMASVPLSEPERPLWVGLIPVGTLVLLEYLFSQLAMKNVKLRALLCGKPAMLVVRGRIDQSQMRKNRFTTDELFTALRQHSVLDLREVEYAILETNGTVNVILSPGNRPVTAGQMQMSPPDPGYPLMVINGGRILMENLILLGRDERWLQKQLRANGIRDPKEVYLMTCDKDDGIFIAPME